MTSGKKGILYGIGVGPGDPELLTIKARDLIVTADVIAYPAPESGESFARQIVQDYIPESTMEYPIRMNIGDGSYPKKEIYDEAAERLLRFAEEGKRVVVLCEGDPFLYGSFIYLFQRLKGRLTIEVVPGISSLNASAAALGQALAMGSETLTIIPALLPEKELRQRLQTCEWAVIIKLGSHLSKVRRVLGELQRIDRTFYIERATLSNQRMMPLADVKEDKAPYFSMLLISGR